MSEGVCVRVVRDWAINSTKKKDRGDADAVFV